jgi:hypothetical protein
MKALKWVWAFMVIATTALNGVQALSIWHVSRQLNGATALRTLEIGETMPSLVAPSIDGELVTVIPLHPPRPLVLYWMSPDCQWCKRNEFSFRTLASALAPAFDVVAIASVSTGISEFIRETRPPYLLLGPPSPAIAEACQLTMTPMTIVLMSDRQVARVWRGAYKGRIRTEVEQYFGVALPDLQF